MEIRFRNTIYEPEDLAKVLRLALEDTVGTDETNSSEEINDDDHT